MDGGEPIGSKGWARYVVVASGLVLTTAIGTYTVMTVVDARMVQQAEAAAEKVKAAHLKEGIHEGAATANSVDLLATTVRNYIDAREKEDRKRDEQFKQMNVRLEQIRDALLVHKIMEPGR